MDKKSKGSLVAERTLRALMLFSQQKHVLVSDIASYLDISLTASYRIIYTLEEMGFIKQGQTKEYVLDSPNILQLYRMVEQDIRNIARPTMKELANQLNESVYLSVIHRDKFYIFIEKEESPLPLKWSEKVGEVRPLPAGTAGKTHLAYLVKDLDNAARDKLISSLELKAYTSKSVTTREDLLRSVEKIWNDGYCHTVGEHIDGVVGISVPVFNFKENNVVAVLSVFMVESRYFSKDLEKFVSALKKGAKKIGKHIF